MKRTAAALFTATALSMVGVAAPAYAGTFYEDPELTVSVNGGAYHHEYELNFTCGTDGAVSFSGQGQGTGVASETIRGSLDTSDRSYTFTSTYQSYVYTYSSAGVLSGPETFGTIAYTGDGTSGVATAVGSFHNVPDCAPAPVPGNHGQYVSGAAKAGIKGQELAAIAKDRSLVGPYVAK